MHSRSSKVGSIGSALPGTHVRIVDSETGVEVGPGVPGRMQVKGGIVMKGYLNDQAQTNLVIQNGYYDTGDIAKMDSDGFIYITGRASRFSKIGGEMVPHEKIEEEIMKITKSENRDVAVTDKSDPRKGEKIVVFYTNSELDPAVLVDQLKDSDMPNIWIPKAGDFHLVEALPLLGSGKLDLRKLKEMAEQLD
jgi:acyl-[acyl-carrier-protein]-phospholipid O-acyltransferase/long-chain-fatty-acid--[acyl-carrier-protein] ligase